MIVLIPSYQPDHRLPALVAGLTGELPDARVIVVDDGSGPSYAMWFERAQGLGAAVLAHDVNRGKGAALRTGFAHIALAFPGEPVVCADSDGQHSPADIRLAASGLDAGPVAMVLGVRRFTGRVPLRSRVGNAATGRVFALVTGRSLVDTQTGLRAYPHAMLPWLTAVPGDRFEYELRLLLAACREGLPIHEIPIETIYLEDNRSSHFRPLQDSARIYGPLLAFAASSVLAFVLDTALLAGCYALTEHLVGSIVAARLVSAGVNYAVNRGWVFARPSAKAPLGSSLARYAALAAALLAANAVMMSSLAALGIPLLLAKLVTEITLFLVSLTVQRAVVFARPRRPRTGPGRPARSTPVARSQVGRARDI